MKKWLWILLVLLAACGQSTTGSSLADPVIPSLTTATGWVVDTTGKLSAEDQATLEDLATQIQKLGFQVGVGIFENCACEPIDFATKFGNQNKLGSADKDNGIAIVIFTSKKGGGGKAPAIAVAVGSGLEAVLTDGRVGRILDATFVPARSSGNWQSGTITLLTGLRDFLNGTKGIDEFQAPPEDHTLLIIIIIIVVVLILIDVIFNGGGITLAILEAAASSSSSSSRSSGSSSLGGGGGFSGGGASR